jgi:hypothetical protein
MAASKKEPMLALACPKLAGFAAGTGFFGLSPGRPIGSDLSGVGAVGKVGTSEKLAIRPCSHL